MKEYLLPCEGNFYKANLHGHTTVSDGRYSPLETKNNYMARGYSIFAYTDHEKLVCHSDLNDQNFLAITSYEISIGKPGSPKTYHFNLFARDENNTELPDIGERAYDIDSINRIIDRANKAGFLVSYNHPFWSMQEYEDYAPLRGLWAMEAINFSSFADGYAGDYSSIAYESMLRSGQKLFAVGTDDNHNVFPFSHPHNDSFGGYTVVKAKSLDYKNVMAALEAGHFYASGKPEIYELYRDGDTIFIRTSPCRTVVMSGMYRTTTAAYPEDGAALTFASFKLNPDEKFFRLEVTDFEGHKAFTNAYFI